MGRHCRGSQSKRAAERGHVGRGLLARKGMSNKNRSIAQMSLAELKAFAIELAESADDESADDRRSIPSHMFSKEGYGCVTLSGAEGDRFSKIVAGLHRKMGDAMSKSSVAGLVQTAILKTLDIHKRHQTQSPATLGEQAIKEVRAALSSPPLTWKSCLPILGITPPKRTWVLGDVRLINIAGKEGKEFMAAADSITDQTRHTAEEKAAFKAQERKELIEEHPGQAFALVTTSALDAEAAWASAKRRLRFVLDCLNFAVGVLHGNQYHELSTNQPRRRHYASGVTINVTSHTSARRHSEVNTAAGTVNAEEFRRGIRENGALRRLWAALASAKPTDHQSRILAAMQWAGRAQAERRDEQAFLFRAIALESLILGDRDQGELTMRLTLSIVHLLGAWLKSRKDAFQQIKKLYGVRSKIVHSGKYEVDPKDFALMRAYVTRCFLHIFGDRRFGNMVAKSDLDEWFEARMRGERDRRK